MNTVLKNKPRARLKRREADIRAAATTLFASDGFHATSTRKIATAAGVSEGTVFHYFNTKNALLLAILDTFYEELTASAREGIQEIMDTQERLLFLAGNHVRILIQNQSLMMRLIQVYLSVDVSYYTDYKNTHIHDLNYQYTRLFNNVIQEGIERGDLDPDLKLPVIRDLFFGGLEYGMRTLLGKNNIADIADYVQAIVDPLWISMQLSSSSPVNNTANVDLRLELACERVEKTATVLATRLKKLSN